MRKSRLPEGGKNIFLEIKKQTKEAQDNGIKVNKLSIGAPGGTALESTIKGAITALESGKESAFEYQDNGTPGVPEFAKTFVQAHVIPDISGRTDLAYLTTPGTKSMLGLFALACGCHINDIKVASMSENGYPIPGIWCKYLRTFHQSLLLDSENKFLFPLSALYLPNGAKFNLIMINYPNNPSGQVAPRKWLEALCQYCEENDIRLVNDAAYSMLVHSDTKDSPTLTEVAINYPNLEFIELFSSSKEVGNGTGLRIGAAVGTIEFIENLKEIKGNTDSGVAAPMAAGVLNSIKTDIAGIIRCRILYEERLKMLVMILLESGMKPVVKPKAGFFVLCEVPKFAYGEKIIDAEHFNKTMLNHTGFVAVPIGKYIRFSVAGFPVEERAQDISAAFEKAQIQY